MPPSSCTIGAVVVAPFLAAPIYWVLLPFGFLRGWMVGFAVYAFLLSQSRRVRSLLRFPFILVGLTLASLGSPRCDLGRHYLAVALLVESVRLSGGESRDRFTNSPLHITAQRLCSLNKRLKPPSARLGLLAAGPWRGILQRKSDNSLRARSRLQLTRRTLGGVSMFNISNRMSWADVVDYLRPYMFRISTPRGFGTGFALSLHANKTLCAVATAAHVADHAHYWEEPVRLEHVASKQVLVARPATRAIFLDEDARHCGCSDSSWQHHNSRKASTSRPKEQTLPCGKPDRLGRLSCHRGHKSVLLLRAGKRLAAGSVLVSY